MSEIEVGQLAVAQEEVGRLVAEVRPEQWGAGTPCSEWTVRDLVNHLVAGNRLFAGILTGRHGLAEGRAALAGDQLGDEPPLAFRESADAVLAAFAGPGVLGGTFTVPFGTVPGVVALHLRITEMLVHGWDLGRALGNRPVFPAGLAEQELAFTVEQVGRVPAGGPFAPAQPAPADADALDRLVAVLGRRP